MDLVLTKWIALKGTEKLARCCQEELRKRFPAAMIRDAAGFSKFFSTEREYQIANGYGAAAIYPLGKGGVLNGLWYLLEQTDAGMEIDLRKIPIRQETVEICEFFDLNPYYMDSRGSLLIQTENGPGLAFRLEHEGIPAAVIGGTNESNDRIIYNQGNKRYLDRPQKEELEKIFGSDRE
ncbi:MAG: hypothetical protein ACI4CZ_01335 [Hominisplanchenecus sp.]